MLKRLLIIFLLLYPLFSQGQRWKRMRYEIVYGAGATNFLGELGGANQIGTDYFKDLEISMTRYVLNLGIRYRTTEYTSLKAGLSYGRLRGDDALTQEPYRHNRNLHFRSPLVEFSTQFEFSWMKETIGSRYRIRRVRGRGRRGSEFYMYGFVGLAGFYFNPKAEYQGKWVALQPLGTEGQELVPSRSKYSRVQVAVPAGIGFKYNVNKTTSIGLEYGLRKTFTDYMDDVSTTYFDKQLLAETYGDASAALSDQSLTGGPNAYPGAPGPFGGCQTCPNQQRGDPTDNDSYMFLLVTVNYKLRTTRRGLPKF